MFYLTKLLKKIPIDVSLFSSIKNLTYHAPNQDDPYITIKEDDVSLTLILFFLLELYFPRKKNRYKLIIAKKKKRKESIHIAHGN